MIDPFAPLTCENLGHALADAVRAEVRRLHEREQCRDAARIDSLAERVADLERRLGRLGNE